MLIKATDTFEVNTSFYFKFNVWRTPLQFLNQKNKIKTPKIQLFGFETYPTWYKIAGTASSDVIGGISFGYLGAITASGTTGYIFWDNEINAAAGWLWHGAKSVIKSACCFLALCTEDC